MPNDDKFSHLTPAQREQLEEILPLINSGTLSLEKYISLTKGLLNNEDKFSHLTPAERAKVEKLLRFIHADTLSVEECLALTDEQYALFSNKHVLQYHKNLTKEDVLSLTPQILQRIANPVMCIFFTAGWSLKRALSIPESHDKAYAASWCLISMTGAHDFQYLSRDQIFSLTETELTNIGWAWQLQFDRDERFGRLITTTFKSDHAEVIGIIRALTPIQKTWLKTEASDTKNDGVPLEELFLQVSRLDLDAVEAPTPSTQPTPAPT